jgi:pectin methylesterase-like acyl-CoA thioesterase
VNALIRSAHKGLLDGCEVFLFTENKTDEGFYFHRSTRRQSLFGLIVVLCKLQMQYDFVLHVVWIAGTRMIKQGTDGLSRWDDNGQATSGVALCGVVPLHSGACEMPPAFRMDGRLL